MIVTTLCHYILNTSKTADIVVIAQGRNSWSHTTFVFKMGTLSKDQMGVDSFLGDHLCDSFSTIKIKH